MLILGDLAFVLIVHAGAAAAYLAVLAVPTWLASRRWGRLAWSPWLALLVSMALFSLAITVFEMLGYIYRFDPPNYLFWDDRMNWRTRYRQDDWPSPWSWPRIVFPLLYVGAAALAATLAARWGRRAGPRSALVVGALAVALLAPYLYASFGVAQFFNACFIGESLVPGSTPNC